MKYSPGNTLLTTLPLVHAVNEIYKGKVCDRCLKNWHELKPCSFCKFMFYCSGDCHHADWQEFHQYECAILRMESMQGKDPIMYNLIRMCIKYQYSKSTFQKSWIMYDGTQRMLGNLMSRVDAYTAAQHPFLVSLLNNLNSCGILVDMNTLMYRFGQLVGNTISICDELRLLQHELPRIGRGLYVEASIFDHSCRPNAMCVFEGRILRVRALTEIDTDKESINISYVEGAVALSREIRRSEIQRIAQFHCMCEICTDENYSDAPRNEIQQLISLMIYKMVKEESEEVERISYRLLKLTQLVFGCYNKTFIDCMILLLNFKCDEICERGKWKLAERIDGIANWTDFESCLQVTHGTEHPFYRACLKYPRILEPSNELRVQKICSAYDGKS